jgi:hypothetical protein
LLVLLFPPVFPGDSLPDLPLPPALASPPALPWSTLMSPPGRGISTPVPPLSLVPTAELLPGALLVSLPPAAGVSIPTAPSRLGFGLRWGRALALFVPGPSWARPPVSAGPLGLTAASTVRVTGIVALVLWTGLDD